MAEVNLYKEQVNILVIKLLSIYLNFIKLTNK